MTTKKQVTTKSAPSAPSKPSTVQQKPSGSDGRGSTKTTTQTIHYETRAIEFDVEGTAEIMPVYDLEARKMVSFQGLGNNFSGDYFLNTVTHTWNRQGYSMSLDVLRNSFVWKVTNPPQPPTNPPRKEEVAPKPATPAPPAVQGGQRQHTVKSGESLWKIAERYYGKGNGSQYTKIINANKGKITDPSKIYPGMVIVIP